jgi:hypothetical protein
MTEGGRNMAKKEYQYLYQELKDIVAREGYDFLVTEELKAKRPKKFEVVVGGRIVQSFQDFLALDRPNTELSHELQYAKYFEIDDDVGKLTVTALQTVAKEFKDGLQIGNIVLLKGSPMYLGTAPKIEIMVAIHSVHLVRSTQKKKLHVLL